ncbi:hypothetical protein ASJ79_14005 [Mycobacterium sp. NAZ190054]|nr:hypothetical protein ASJ79_14005 [Mycobacterium sp. NAZ190054]
MLTLRAYFAERQRTGHRFVADALSDLCEQHRIATSVVLRAIAGFGPSHVVRSDRTLSLSEDPPVTVWATDRAERIRALADDAAQLIASGMLTLERGGLRRAEETTGARLTLHLGRKHRVAGTVGYVAVCDVLRRLGFLSGDVYLGVDGTFGGQRRRAKFFSGNTDVPLSIVAVGTSAQAAAAIDELRTVLPEIVFSVTATTLCKAAGRHLATPAATDGPFQQLTVLTEEAPRRGGRPVHRALIRRLEESGPAGGATVIRAIRGFRGAQAPHGDRFLQVTRHAPVSTIIAGTTADIAATYPLVDELTEREGLVTVEPLPGMLEVHSGHRFGDLRPADDHRE